MQRLSAIWLVPALALMLAACGASSKPSAPQATPAGASSASGVTVKSATVKPYGQILVNSQGHALYTFAPDEHARVTCTGSCASNWPPLMLKGVKPVAGTGVNQSLLGSDPDPSGGHVVTYADWPLYAYILDSSAGEASGQGLDASGGHWYVITPAGKQVMTKPGSGSSAY